MKTVKKAVAVVLRSGEHAPEVLVFRHPLAGVQIPKGTVEDFETVESATLRELEEESGLALEAKPKIIGTWNRTVGGGPDEGGPSEINEWHIAILKPDTHLPDLWSHDATGSPAEEGLTFEFFWLPVDKKLAENLHPLFAETAKIIAAHESP